MGCKVGQAVEAIFYIMRNRRVKKISQQFHQLICGKRCADLFLQFGNDGVNPVAVGDDDAAFLHEGIKIERLRISILRGVSLA